MKERLGWAIILLTLIIRTILLVPSHKSMRAQKKMQDLQPRLEKIKEKFVKSKTERESEQMIQKVMKTSFSDIVDFVEQEIQ